MTDYEPTDGRPIDEYGSPKFRIDPSLKVRAQARAARERTTLTDVVAKALEEYSSTDEPTTPLNDLRRRAAQLQRAIKEAPDDETARHAADELHRLLDLIENIHMLRSKVNEDY